MLQHDAAEISLAYPAHLLGFHVIKPLGLATRHRLYHVATSHAYASAHIHTLAASRPPQTACACAVLCSLSTEEHSTACGVGLGQSPSHKGQQVSDHMALQLRISTWGGPLCTYSELSRERERERREERRALSMRHGVKRPNHLRREGLMHAI